MKPWPSIYHAKHEPDPLSGLAIIAPEKLKHTSLCKISKLWDLDLKVIS